ncbi:MAG: hypothetical protein AAB730_02265, partial [Patescibacteria group bacterium]
MSRRQFNPFTVLLMVIVFALMIARYAESRRASRKVSREYKVLIAERRADSVFHRWLVSRIIVNPDSFLVIEKNEYSILVNRPATVLRTGVDPLWKSIALKLQREQQGAQSQTVLQDVFGDEKRGEEGGLPVSDMVAIRNKVNRFKLTGVS